MANSLVEHHQVAVVEVDQDVDLEHPHHVNGFIFIVFFNNLRMSVSSIFKQLTSGVNFNKNAYKSEAKRFGLGK